MNPETPDAGELLDADVDAGHEAKNARALLRKTIDKFGWKLINRTSVEIRCERTFRFGPRTAVVRGRVAIPLPDPLTAEHGDAEAALLVAPAADEFRTAMERAAIKLLSEPDDVAQTHVFERSSFFTALADARRGIVQAYQLLENRRVDEKVETELGLRFYVDGFSRERRTFEYFVGPTNSGKTYAAIEILREAASGTYLAPLRLLALEVYERLNDIGVPASLVTGEERVLHPAARAVSSTVEMVDLAHRFDVAVIDEAQMLEDEQRGWAWTLAIAGVRAKRVVLCGSEEGLHAAERLALRLGVTIAVRRFERKNPLRVVPAVPLTALQKGDAVVAFSRRGVVELQAEIARLSLTSAAIYGSLSPVVRRREAERFRTGVADVLVATDAIGLGLNLPIRRLIFATIEKFDGIATRLLRPHEIRQIAGRAGRYGIHEEGQVTARRPGDVAFIRRGLEVRETAPSDGPIWISPTDDHLRRLSAIIGTTRISRLLQFFHSRVLRDGEAGLRIADLTDTIDVATALELSEGFLDLPFEVRCTYVRAPVTTRGNSLDVLARWGAQHAHDGVVVGRELMAGGVARDRLVLDEDRSRVATLYLWLAQRFPDVYANHAEVTLIRESIDADIHNALLARGAAPKRVRATKFSTKAGRPKTFGPRRKKR